MCRDDAQTAKHPSINLQVKCEAQTTQEDASCQEHMPEVKHVVLQGLVCGEADRKSCLIWSDALNAELEASSLSSVQQAEAASRLAIARLSSLKEKQTVRTPLCLLHLTHLSNSEDISIPLSFRF